MTVENVKSSKWNMDCILKLPGDVMDALRLPPDDVEAELHKELALALYYVAYFLQAKHVPLRE